MVTRVGGLASGMDIDSIVEKLMSAEKAPLTKLYQQQTKYEWERDAYREINTALGSFDDYLFDNYRLSSNFYKKTVSSTNSDLVTATATSAASGTLTIEGVTQLATPWQGVGTTINKSSDTKMKELGINGSTTISINSIKSDGSLASKAVDISISETDSISDVIKRINASGAGVSAIFEKGTLSITANNTGVTDDGKSVEITDSSNVLRSLGLDLADNTNITQAKNAKLQINGIATERSSNSFTLNGYTVSLKSTFNSNTPGETTVAPVTLSSSTDTDNMVDKIKKFVETYNGLVTTINGKLKETYNRNFPPLTDEQKEDMSEDEIEKWEKKAQTGLLRNDSILTNGLYSMRRTFMDAVGGLGDATINSLAEIGITTSSTTSDGGKLVLDEDKLRTAIEKNADQVASIFTKTGTAKDASKGITEDTRGIAQRLRDELKSFTGEIEKKAGKASATNQTYTLGKRLDEVKTRIDAWVDKLEGIESRYWKQFTAMETAINKANSQSSLFSQA
ncbi:flagellar hook-associated protein 2 [Lysinibacillus sp. SGAir0095]|uniref:flagellar hook-associated protein 2 n=1 Tax=Lysinibacillus sp. SGAir0095 TaxID=2070463 RepID=UPI0010CD5352|nr:flagellar hook-associated protein 2 [Lysinibacillus sp. SGAir0095]QCR31526.1 flagellar hook protein FliD [Lysinibacillus sp. SGAir0095]